MFAVGDKVTILEYEDGEFVSLGIGNPNGTITSMEEYDDGDGLVRAYLVELADGTTIDVDGDDYLAHRE